MMEAEMATTQQEPPSKTGQNDVVRELLALARRLINQGKPSQALQAVVVAMKTEGGDEAVFQFLHRARELYKSRLQENAAVDQLASLFTECAIAEAQPIKTESSANNVTGPSVVPDAHGTSILAETGRMQTVLDAFSDGSCFICLRCGGLVSNHRKDEHYAYWCCQL
ncbi:2-methoxy-6-polyprenyl-1,4-benzoquinol methylase [Quillaja saponaria]|uniref:2-methoxy-6-polyprenyl-1,4-benzoquinol methylase n=1 Tax=Quillaja saponaria TaxID=32244 RepID=A0AAD7LHT1_QUISA|nr:2-methoxy-6-polyprenyl-1,4-benzoquinol methylase [Quillaja saponaria]